MTSSFEEISTFLKKGVQEEVFPCVCLVCGNFKKNLYQNSIGKLNPEEEIEANLDTCFDIASLTKVMITGILYAKGLAEKRFQLTDQANKYLKPLKHSFSIAQLLSHCSGLPAWKPYYEIVHSPFKKEEGKTYYLDKINHEKLEAPAKEKTIYSDLGFILLGFLLEEIYQQDLKTLAMERIIKPLGLKNTSFGPKIGLSVAPTGICPHRKKLIQGEVNDLNAWALGGVAGHAGIFSTVLDVAMFSRAVLGNLKGKDIFCPPSIFKIFTQRQKTPPDSSWALAWDTPWEKGSSAGKYWNQTGIGHLGFTGCSLWLDPKRDFFVACLSNRVHPNAKNEKIKSFRPKLHDLIIKTFFN